MVDEIDMQAWTIIEWGLVIAAMLVGAVLWIGGRRLAKPAVTMSGFVVAGAGVAMWMHGWAGPITIACVGFVVGLIGAGLAWMLFRVWMAMSGALVMSLVFPLMGLLWVGMTPPLPEEETRELISSATQEASEIESVAELREIDSEHSIGQLFLDAYQQQIRVLREWWHELSDAAQRNTMLSAGAGAVLGLILGLLAPHWAASVQSAVAGTLILLAGLQALLATFAPQVSQSLPHGGRATVLAMGLITIAGVFLQWTFRPRRTDK